MCSEADVESATRRGDEVESIKEVIDDVGEDCIKSIKAT